MQKLDWHCDVLYKLETESGMGFNETSELDVTPERLLNGGVRLQCFAMFVSGNSNSASFTRLMKQISTCFMNMCSPIRTSNGCGVERIWSRSPVPEKSAHADPGRGRCAARKPVLHSSFVPTWGPHNRDYLELCQLGG